MTPHLGVGAYKVAYRASRADEDVVIKIVMEPAVGDDDELANLPERFARELLGMESVACPHVVKVLDKPSIRDVGASQHLWYLEPFYEGPTLEKAIADGQSGPELCEKVLLHMLRAVKAMWESPSKIVHRDIKPGNIIFNGEDLVLLDLGIAFHADLSAITDSFMQSPKTRRYAAPEQFEVRRYATIDFRTDLYLVGMVAFEAATGKHPFWQQGIQASEYLRRMANFSAIQLDGSGVEQSRVHLITRLLAERPAGRYRSVDQPLAIVEEGP
ncbi:MAG: protein kinase [Micrococcales bacterium]|nr:protein kinase [Micrococcales bacterium]